MAERETVASEGELCHKPCEWGKAYIGHRAEDRSESECLGVALRIGSIPEKRPRKRSKQHRTRS